MSFLDLTLKDCRDAALLHQQTFFKGWSEKEFSDLLKKTSIHGLKWEDQRTLKAFILWQQVEDEAEILTLVVDPVFQRQKIGSFLLKALLDKLRQERVENLFLEVAEDNVAGQQFYIHQKFSFLRERPKYYRRVGNNYISALIFYKKIV